MRRVLLGLLLCVGCEGIRELPNAEWQCVEIREDERQQAAQFIVDCAKAANPMSDEEGEDLVYQCRASAQQVFCERRPMFWRGHPEGYVDCRLADTEPEVESCRRIAKEKGK